MYKYAQIARPLNKLISGKNSKKKHKKVEWGNEQEKAFQELKEACTRTPVLAYANYKKSFRLNTDASELGRGSVLYQQAGRWYLFVSLLMLVDLCRKQRKIIAHTS